MAALDASTASLHHWSAPVDGGENSSYRTGLEPCVADVTPDPWSTRPAVQRTNRRWFAREPFDSMGQVIFRRGESFLRRIRLGLVGAGIIVQRAHVPALKELAAQYRIVAVCSAGVESARHLAAALGPDVDVCSDVDELLDRPDIDAVDIATPIALNARLAEKAASHGKHVFLEKPIAAHIEQASEVAALPERYGIVLLVAETNRYLPGYAEGGRLSASAIGSPRLLHWHNISLIGPENAYSRTAWRQRPSHAGGYLSDGGVHAAASLQMVAGPVLRVHALTASFNPDLLGEIDTMAMNLTFASGICGSMTFSVGIPNAVAGPLTVYGTAGRLEAHPNHVSIYSQGTERVIELGEMDPFVAEFRDFYDAIVDSKPLRAAPEDALADLRIVEAALLSAREGTAVDVSDVG